MILIEIIYFSYNDYFNHKNVKNRLLSLRKKNKSTIKMLEIIIFEIPFYNILKLDDYMILFNVLIIRFNGFSGSIGDRSISNGNISSMGGGGGDRMPPSFPENIRGGDMRDIMNHRDRDMMGGGSGDSRGFFRDLVDTRGHDPRSIGGGGGGAPDHRMSREYQLQLEMRERVS